MTFHFTAKSSLIRQEKLEKAENKEAKGDMVINTKPLHVIFTRLQLTHKATCMTSIAIVLI